jgi:hypothetical protein
VGAGGANGEECVVATRKENRMLVDVPEQHLSIGNRVGCDTQRQIGAGRCGVITGHINLPLPYNSAEGR